jgi:hypothetical protein
LGRIAEITTEPVWGAVEEEEKEEKDEKEGKDGKEEKEEKEDPTSLWRSLPRAKSRGGVDRGLGFGKTSTS